jgi:hypothetical protein
VIISTTLVRMSRKQANDSLEQRLIRLQTLSKSSLAQLFHGVDDNDEDIIANLCDNLVYVVDKFADHDQVAVSLSQDIGILFLRETLPVLIELLLRRKNGR